MAKDINLNSSEWCDVVFEGKNKSYGAYKMRQTSSKRHIYAFVVVALLAAFITALPTLINFVTPKKDLQSGVTDAYKMVNVAPEVPPENVIKQQVAPPPPPMKSTVKFTPPVIAHDEEVNDKNELKSQDDLNKSKVQISVADVQGTDDKNGADIADLADHKVVVEDKDAKPLDFVEQMPSFPGGDAALMKFLHDHLTYPSIASENGIQGRVSLKFIVGRDGTVSNVQVIKSLEPSCDREAVRVVKLMPKWIPGKQNGKQVAVNFNLPVVFKLQDQ